MREVYIVGAGMVKVDRHYDKGLIDLAYKAIEASMKDTDIRPKAIVVANAYGELLQEQSSIASHITAATGFRSLPASRVECGGATGGCALLSAYSMVASGLYDSVLVVGVEKLTDYAAAAAVKAQSSTLDAEYEASYGITTAGINALIMRYYMSRYNVSRDELSEWPVLMHDNASENPYAQIKRRIKKESVARSQIVADPITILDSSPIGDGAAAVLLASREEARKQKDSRVLIAGIGSAIDSVDLNIRDQLDTLVAAKIAANQAYKLAGLEPKTIDVVELHDVYTINGILLIEDLGFSEKGRGAKDLVDGRFRAGDKPSVNLSGGLKARGHPTGATGVYQTAEVYLQLIGEFKGRKVHSAETGIVLSMGDIGENAIAIALKLP